MRRRLLLLTLGLTILFSLGANEVYYLSNSIGQKLSQISEVDLYDSAYSSGYVLHVSDEQQQRIRKLYRDSTLQWEETEALQDGQRIITRSSSEGELLSRRVYSEGLLRHESLLVAGKRIELEYQYDGQQRLSRISDADNRDTHVLTTDSGMLSAVIADSYRLLIDSYDDSLALGTASAFTLIQSWDGGELKVEYEDDTERSSILTERLEDGSQRITERDMVSGVKTVGLYDPGSLLVERKTFDLDGESIESLSLSYDERQRVIERVRKNSGADEQRLEYEYLDSEQPYKITEYLQGGIHSVTTITNEGKQVRLYRKGVPYALVHYDADDTIQRIEYE